MASGLRRQRIQGLQNNPELPFWASVGQSSDPLTPLGNIVYNLPVNIVDLSDPFTILNPKSFPLFGRPYLYHHTVSIKFPANLCSPMHNECNYAVTHFFEVLWWS